MPLQRSRRIAYRPANRSEPAKLTRWDVVLKSRWHRSGGIVSAVWHEQRFFGVSPGSRLHAGNSLLRQAVFRTCGFSDSSIL
jgi:hypothetical protein